MTKKKKKSGMGSKQITKTRRNYTREINLKLLQIMNPPNKLERTHLLAKNEKQDKNSQGDGSVVKSTGSSMQMAQGRFPAPTW